jgi:tetratricopeptide (TPR) repeat protein
MGTSALNSMHKRIHKRSNSFRIMHVGAVKSNSCLSSVQGMRNTAIRLRQDSCDSLSFRNIQNVKCTMSNSEGVSSDDAFSEHVLHGRQNQKLGYYMEALAYFQNALECKKQTIDAESTTVQTEYANVLFNIGAIYMTKCKNVQQSAEVFEQCLEWRIHCLGSSHIDVSATMYCLARVHMMAGDDYMYAVTLLNEALSILLVECPNHTNSIIAVWKELARAQYTIGEIDDAESSIKEIKKLTAQPAPFCN